MPRGEFKILWLTNESVGYEINLARGSKEELQISVPKTIAHNFRHRERVRVIIEKIPEVEAKP